MSGEGSGRSKGWLESISETVDSTMKRMNIGFTSGPTSSGGFGVGIQWPREEPMTSSVTISPKLLESLERRRSTSELTPMAPPPSTPAPTLAPPTTPPPSPKPKAKPVRRNTMPASQMWPEWANHTYRDPTAETRSQTRQLEQRLATVDKEFVPIVGPYFGASKEWQRLYAGTHPDMLTAMRMARLGLAVTPLRFFPGTSVPMKFATKQAVGMGATQATRQVKASTEGASSSAPGDKPK